MMTEARYLVVIIDEKRNFQDHVERVCRRVTAAMEKISSMTQDLSDHAAST